MKSNDEPLKNGNIEEMVPADTNGWVTKGDHYVDHGQYPKAIECYNQALGIDHHNINALCQKGITLAKLWNDDEAINCFTTALNINSQSCEALLSYGIGLYYINRDSEAIKKLERALELEPENPNIVMWNAIVLPFTEFRSDSEEYIKKAWTIYLKNPENYDNLLLLKGRAYYNLKKYYEALKCFDEYLIKKPDNIETILRKALVYSFIGEIDVALDIVDSLLILNPKNSLSLYYKGYLLLNKREYDDSIKNLDAALKINPNYQIAFFQKGNAFLYLEKYRDAELCFDTVLKNHSYDPDVWNNKGITLTKLEQEKPDYSNAIHCFDKALQIDPDYKNALQNKGMTLLDWYDTKKETKCIELSISCFDKIIKNDSTDYDAWCNKGIALAKIKDYKQARKCFETASKIREYSGTAELGYKFVKELDDKEQTIQSNYLDFQGKLIEGLSAVVKENQEYLSHALKDFRLGLNVSLGMYIGQFFIGVVLIAAAIYLYLLGKTDLLTYLFGGGGVTIFVLLIFKPPQEIQKNRVDLTQWLIAYYNWNNSFLAINTHLARKFSHNVPSEQIQKSNVISANKKIKDEWTDLKEIIEYLGKMTYDTINIIEASCEPKVQQNTQDDKEKKTEGKEQPEQKPDAKKHRIFSRK
ncbi:MAG: tetratricopeptide repeat protein [Methanoregula sp.]